jgi:colanic acid biosynthesis glycosyl transferase WcaI
MKILFLTHEGFDTAGPNNQMAATMIRDFLDYGYQVHLIQSERKQTFPSLPAALVGKEGLTTDIIPRKVIDKTRFVLRYVDELWYTFQSFLKWHKIKDANIVFLQSCPTAVFQLMFLKIFCRKPIIFNIYDVFPGHAHDLGVIHNKLIFNIFRNLQKFAYLLSDKIVVLSEDMKKIIINEGVQDKKIRTIPAWYDDAAVYEISEEANRFLKKYDIEPGKFVVQFAGTIGYVFNYKLVLKIAELLENHTNIVFQIIGDGAFKDNFMREANEKHLKNIEFYPLQPLEIVPDVYSACSVCIIPLKKGVIGNGVPSKAPLLMACRRVIINSVESDSEYYRIFNDNKMGISVPTDDAYGLASAILMLSENPQATSEMADRAKQYSKEHFSASICTHKFIDIFDELRSVV